MSNEAKLINIGFGNIVMSSRIIAIVSPDSSPIKRLLKEAEERGQLVDVRHGRPTRSVIVMDSGHLIRSAIQPETIANRLASQRLTDD